MRTHSQLALVISTVVFAGALSAMPVQAAAGCTTTTPALDQTITCSTAGSETISVPAGANAVRVVVIGGGGGGATSSSLSGALPGGAGGKGAQVGASLFLSQTTSLDVVVGAGGAGGSAGLGGSFSSVSSGSTLLAVAGGGGGGGQSAGGQGGSGGSGAAQSTPAGGNGGDSGGSGNGGSGGNDGVGGLGGVSGGIIGFPGASWVAGGAGGASATGTGGEGGAGYGGGGGGGTWLVTNNARPGGGAGGSYANPSTRIGTATFEPSSGIAGAGGAGAPANSGVIGSSGTAGSVQLTFFYAPPEEGPTPTAPLQQVGMPLSGSCTDVDDAQLGWNTGIRGGWTATWAEWRRGPACERQFIYDRSRASWVVG